jgi:beta-lactamase regulating signal transducer with metallopeptidase domain
MDTALHLGLTNVAVAALIAVAAAAFSLIRSRPALSHALWLLVILKLLTPPLWGVRIDRGWLHAAEPARETPRDVSQPLVAKTPIAPPDRIVVRVVPPVEVESAAPVETEPPFEDPRQSQAPPARAVATPASARSVDGAAGFARWLPPVAAFVWFIGSVVCAATILIRVVRFHRLLRFAELASPALQGRAAALARRMGMARAPRVWFVPGAVSPMLWPLGRIPRVLIPSGLWDRLDESQRRSLLAHELAHLRRRDHWVRLPEVLASVLYWWCPLTWYARRRLREAEEQCCDAWVVWAFPEAARDYASALLETVDFVATGGRLPLPVLASGMGQFHQLRRRLVMIKHAHTPRTMSGPTWLAVGALALGLLPLAPTLAQVSVSATPPAADSSAAAASPAGAVPAAVPPLADGVSVESAPTTDVGAGLPPAAPVAARPGSEGDLDVTIINDLKTKPVPRIAIVKAGKATGVARDQKLEKAREEARNQVHELSVQLKLAEQRLADLERAAGKAENSRGWGAKPGMPVPLPPLTPPPAPGYAPPSANLERYGSSSYAPGGGYGVVPGKRDPFESNASRERRLDAIEANLNALLREVRAMREKQSNHAPDVSPAR